MFNSSLKLGSTSNGNLFRATERMDDTTHWDVRTILTGLTESGTIDGKKAYEAAVTDHGGWATLASISDDVIPMPKNSSVPCYVLAHVAASAGRTVTAAAALIGADANLGATPNTLAAWVDTTTGDLVLEETGTAFTTYDYGKIDLGNDEYLVWVAATWEEPEAGWYLTPYVRPCSALVNNAGTSIIINDGDSITPLGRFTGLHCEFTFERPTYNRRG